ncbi:hypothetical protein DSM104443_03985 [Usitatibacter rugosus]|uniref:Uncharacterized protein n=1 Tax=Usitatibacter rugosus TaxID=2732067 RepID=A0A6M4H059_9PROT|nr:hypothetical protein [Usitatibacter rugosus]QJR12891.1 hypothetical protein DSM104443_03985 [Usitatibacter rugosus]
MASLKEKLATASAVVNAIDALAEEYSDRPTLRASLHLLPHLGPALDALLDGRAAAIFRARIEHFIVELHGRLECVEANSALDLNSPAFLDVMRNVFEHVERTRSESKRAMFAGLVAHQIAAAPDWEETELAMRLLSSLDLPHIEVLVAATSARVCDGAFVGLRTIALKEGEVGPAKMPPELLTDKLPGRSREVLLLVCAELVSMGLLHDEGIGRWNGTAMQYLVPTELADWLLARIVDIPDLK